MYHQLINFNNIHSFIIKALSSKYGSKPAAIDFASYKKKLNFTASAVGSLEDLYKKKKLPTFSATLPAFEAKKRALMLQTAADLVNATKADLKDLYVQLENFEKERFTKHTTVGQTMQRFPKIAKEVEQELKEHKYLVDAV